MRRHDRFRELERPSSSLTGTRYRKSAEVPTSALACTDPIKSIRYENATHGTPPLLVHPVNRNPSFSSPILSVNSRLPARSLPPCTPRASAPSCSNRRDSGISTPISPPGRILYSERPDSPVKRRTTREFNLLSTVVHDDDDELSPVTAVSPSCASSQPTTDNSRVSRDNSLTLAHYSPTSSYSATASSNHKFALSFNINEISLEDLCSDKLSFSHRGSLLFAGHKMQELIVAQSANGTNGHDQPVLSSIKSSPTEDQASEQRHLSSSNLSPSVPQDHDNDLDINPSRESGLDRRPQTPEVSQAHFGDGRVLSSEETAFSLRVRTMYERGVEEASVRKSLINKPLAGLGLTEATVEETAKETSNSSTGIDHSAPSSELLAPSMVREATEIAGGIEDWANVESSDVDRYGFIQPKTSTSHNSNNSSPLSGQGVQRVATSLRLAAQPSRHKRISRLGFAPARSSRSLPPRPGSGGASSRGPTSVHSLSTDVSTLKSLNPFSSRNQKTLDTAGEMLTFHPELANITEQDELGKAVSPLKQREWRREEKWQKMARPTGSSRGVKGGGMDFSFDTTDSKVISRTWKGIPDRWRATVWHSFLSTSARKRGSNVSDDQLILEYHRLQEQGSADDIQIDMDVPRTVNMHIMFRRRYRGGQRLLFRVLHAISLYFPCVGYVQGMASLAATLLCYYDEGKAFVMMVRLWQLRGLEQLFQAGFEGLLAALNEFERDWLRDGNVAQKLNELNISSTAYGTRWYLTLFNMSVPFAAQLRVWDVFMLLGDAASTSVASTFGGADLDVLHATSAALIDATRDIVLDSDFENAMKVLTSFIPIKDEDILMRVARAEWKLRKKRSGHRT